ncbi:MAG TPA: VOC family protein [Polyangiales bacterium]|nr:VOC family protein [Polyangiales bacterium]
MKLNHIDIQVSDVQRSSAFFQQHFGLTPVSNPSSPAIAILNDGHDFVLVLQHSEGANYPEGFHVGFRVDDVQTVRDVHARVCAAGVTVSEVIVNGRGTHVYVTAPDGYFVELTCARRAFHTPSTE